MRASSLSFMIQVLIEQVNTLAVLILSSPLKVVITSFANSREACGLQALVFDAVCGSLISSSLLFTLDVRHKAVYHYMHTCVG